MPAGQHFDGAGVRTYYEISGSGPPLLFLQGGLCPIRGHAGLIRKLAKSHTVIAPDRRGHGCTPDVPGPIDYETLIDDLVELCAGLGQHRVDVLGYSDGAALAHLLARRSPHLVRRIVSVGAALHADAVKAPAETSGETNEITAEEWAPSMLAIHRAQSPDGPDHFPVVFRKYMDMWRAGAGMTDDDLASCGADVLVVVGEFDTVPRDHSDWIVATVPSAELHVVAGATHSVVWEAAGELVEVTREFLGRP